MNVRVGADGKAKVGRKTVTFPLTLAGATVTVPDPEPDNVPDGPSEDV